MSNDLPPEGPYGAQQPPQPPVGGPQPPTFGSPQQPWGAPGVPPVPGPGQGEVLEMGGGSPIPPEQRGRGGRGRRIALLGGAVVGVAALGSAATWAVLALSGGGPQPAEGLPSTTVAYLSVDLDPSAGQKIEAMKTLKKFPAFDDAVDMNAQDDIRRELFDAIQKDSECEGLDYDDDIASWLGNRAAVAGVDVDGKPKPVVVLQVSDEKAAEAGLTAIAHCSATGDADESGDTSGDLGWKISDGWAVISESDDVAEQVVAATADGSLAEDSTYTKWVDEVGDPGIVTMYVSPDAGTLMLDSMDSLGGAFGDSLGMTDSYTDEAQPSAFTGGAADDGDVPPEVTKALEDFKGMAATIRFADGGMELEVAGDPGDQMQIYGTGAGTDVMATLPTDTAAAFGMRFADGWFTKVLDSAAASGDIDVDEILSSMEDATGLGLPEDAETLMGDSAVISLGSDFDVNTMEQSSDGSGIPVGLKVHGDPAAIEDVLDKVRGQLPEQAQGFIESDSSGEMVAVAPDDDYRAALVGDGGLGDTADYRDVIRGGDKASVLFYVNFDANDWLTELAQDDQEAQDNLEPLSGLGMSAWVDGDASHMVLRVTTD
ncbi:MAG: DUF3352 domain-containing protein [Nocardioidaceae bacterium]